MWRAMIDSEILSANKPIITSGGEQISSNIIFPGRVTNFSKETTVTPLDIGGKAASIIGVLQEIERSMEQESQSNIREGQLPKGNVTAYAMKRAEITPAITQYGIFGRMMAQAIKEFGDLMVDGIIHYQTMPEIEEVLGGKLNLKYKMLLLPN